MSEPLVAQGAVSPVECCGSSAAEVETRGQLDATTLAIPRAESAIEEVQRKIDETRGKFRSEALTQLNEARTDLNKAKATARRWKTASAGHWSRRRCAASSSKLLVNTIGGVIQPGSDMAGNRTAGRHAAGRSARSVRKTSRSCIRGRKRWSNSPRMTTRFMAG